MFALFSQTMVGLLNALSKLRVLTRIGICEGGLTFWLIEELLESQVIEHCRRVFDYLELRREAMVAVSAAINQVRVSC